MRKNGWREVEWQKVGEWLYRETGAKGMTAVEGGNGLTPEPKELATVEDYS